MNQQLDTRPAPADLTTSTFSSKLRALALVGLSLPQGAPPEAQAVEPSAAKKDATLERTKALIGQLGHDLFRTREAASRQLGGLLADEKTTDPVAVLLQKALKHADPEVRMRAG